MRRDVLVTMLLAALSIAGTAIPSAVQVKAGSTRPLFVFAPSDGDDRLARQRAINAGAAGGFRERDMTVTVVAGSSVSGSGRTAGSLRARFGVAPGQFRVILVGKDGGVKLSSGAPVSAGTLYQLIDAMPMRREEMRRRDR